MLVGAAAYGILYVNPADAAAISDWLRLAAVRLTISVAISYIVYRFSGLLEDAIAEAKEKVC